MDDEIKLMVHKMQGNETLMDEIFKFDSYNLEATSSADISRYYIGLAQYLIYFSSQINISKVKLMRKRKELDLSVNRSDIKAKTKAEKVRKVIDNDAALKQLEVDIEGLECELALTDNLGKGFVELINAFKREQTRRAQEHQFARNERV